MNSKLRILVTFGILVSLVLSLYFFTDWFSKVTGYFTGEKDVEKLVSCLNEKNVELYTSFNCKLCEEQAKVFGQYYKNLNIVNCGDDMEFCSNLKSVPAWFIDYKVYYGNLSIEELKQFSGCE